MTEEPIMQNPVKIDLVKLETTLQNAPVINLYSHPLKFPVLQLFEFAYGLLFDVGIDPNSLVAGQPVYTRFWAYWNASEKRKSTGSRYVNVEALKPITALESPDAHLAKIGKTVEEIANMLAAATKQDRQTDWLTLLHDPATMENHPGDEESAHAPDSISKNRDLAEELFGYAYLDGFVASEEAKPYFDRYRRAHNEQRPPDVNALRSWVAQQARQEAAS